MHCKNIAVLMTGLDSDAQAETLKGIEKYGKSMGYNIAVFLWFTGAFERDKHNLGEINLAHLPDLNLFDGVIVFANTLHTENNRRIIEGVLEGVYRPVVTIGCKINDSYSVSTDSYTSMKKLVEHFVMDHKMRRIHFVKGIEGNIDAEARYQAYKDVLAEHNIPLNPERVSQGDFYVTGGELAAKEILSSDLPFPEAIVCANDIMALTICDIFKEKGYSVPEDVAIAGYDYTMEGQFHSPKLTTVRSRFQELGREACKQIIDVCNGIAVEKDILLPDEMVLSESCGCNKAFTNHEVHPKVYYSADVNQRKMIHQMILLEKDIIEGEGFDDWCNSLKHYISLIDPPEFYCCANSDFIETVFETDVMTQEEMSLDERLAYSSEVKVLIAYQNGLFKNKAPFQSGYALDNLFQDSEKKKTYIFSPLHYLERNFGYFVFVDSTFPIINPMYIHWLINMGDSIENIRKQSLLKNVMGRLDEMYIRDSLTGVYNRFGMERFFSEIKKKCLMSRLKMQLSFIDLDKLKRINDDFGHEEGDRIINSSARILKKNAGRFYVVRYGGDEFIVMGTVRDTREVEDYWNRVEKDIEDYNCNSKKLAELSMSFGYEVFEVGAETSLEDCIRVTDKKMYECKKGKRR